MATDMAATIATDVATSSIAAGLGCVIMSESSFSATPTDDSSNAASLSSTPPTTCTPDSMSLASEPDATKPASMADATIEAVIPILENEAAADDNQQQQQPGELSPVGQAIVVAEPLPSTESLSTGRPRRARASLPVYNLSQLSGTDKRRRRVAGQGVQENRRRTIAGDAGGEADANRSTGIDVLALGGSVSGTSTPKGARISSKTKPIPVQAPIVTRRATRQSGAPVETLATKVAALGRKGRKSAQSLGRISRELMRLQDTNEFAHIDTRPVKYTVWSNGKYVDVDPAAEPPRKKTKVDGKPKTETSKERATTEPSEPVRPPVKQRRVKQWHRKGLYAGQETPTDITQGLTTQEKKQLAQIPELLKPVKANKTLPLPMYNGLRMLIHGRDFKLPFDVCNPLPPGQPKPPAYRTIAKNRFVGDAAAYWKKSPHFEDFSSKCVCKPEDGCAEDCQNRIMLYECDDTNCNAGREFCQNRAFQDLQERTKKGGRFRVGVEVLKTSDRGYGVRSTRCFEPNQIIMEYTGEIITEEECERRMNEKYKDNECYYLMSFDQNMIIDATTGSMARFVNHSCSPNCRMIKWIVSGQPRMALFAGDKPIMTGDELTYDYNFDPFSAKNVQKCLCGSANCRGVLGPKPKEVKPPKPAKQEKKTARGSIKAGKRKLKELLVGAEDEASGGNAAKKRKVQPAAGVKKTLTAAAKGAAKTAAAKGKGLARGVSKSASTAIKRSVSGTISLGASALKSTKGAGVKKTTTTTQRKVTSVGLTKTFGKRGVKTTTTTTTKIKLSAKSTSSKATIVAAGPKPTPKKPAAGAKASTPASASASAASARKRTPSRKALEASTPDAGNTSVKGTSASSDVKAKVTTTTTTTAAVKLKQTKIKFVPKANAVAAAAAE
ncbi:uncharacterized protein PODANS_1_20820 [Podospora anserina S mat+]|uniref:Histone-lysine N-methyltransferase n=2 Tax=Podospora anserina TaxID=2587412 RepID=B2ABI8_PODAN|nr:uncharacterized protein PODANS_1_20820 [Podospora anserina S mat+]CAP60810.1 unnamed protein product [Podospora anserina S mat+]CDN30002.1 Putative histone-lysine N-methyltransferase [Podospora anserina]CDP24473.1 Putative histone-lysine N-methyltransferase [Podospora anserina S mat+]